MLRSLPYARHPGPSGRSLASPWRDDVARYGSIRLFLAAVLRSASALLSQLAQALAAEAPVDRDVAATSVLEFYAESGAPEGALYADGVLIGYLPGLHRL